MDQQLEPAGGRSVSLAAPAEKRCLTPAAAESAGLWPSGLVTGAVSKGACGTDWNWHQGLSPENDRLPVSQELCVGGSFMWTLTEVNSPVKKNVLLEGN